VSNDIVARVERLRAELPPDVEILAAAKTRTAEEVRAAAEAGITMVGHNYVQEAATMRDALKDAPPLRWHFIGHLQRNKARRAVEIFDVIETIDSERIARAVDRHCAETGKVMPVLVEINSGREANKAGVFPENARALIEAISGFEHIRVMGLMTMGPWTDDAEALRPCFKATRRIYDDLAAHPVEGVEMARLSMGMSDSWQVAVEEGANRVRIGTGIFGPRPAK